MMFNNTASVIPHVKSGRLRAVALTSAERSPLVPGVPTIAESELPGFAVRSWHGVFVPASTSAEIVNLLNERIVAIQRMADVRDRLDAQGVELVGNRPAEFAAFIAGELAKWGKIV